jgi:uncharacterized protein (TIGR02271 family)
MYEDITPGAVVECRDGRLGTVERLAHEERHGYVTDLIVRREGTGETIRVPAQYVDKVRSPKRVLLSCTLQELEAARAMTNGGLGQPEQVTVPVVAEDLVARKEAVTVGELQVRKLIEEHERTISEPVSYDEVVVERVPIGKRVGEELAPRQEGDTLVIPVVEEQLVCEKQRVLVEEIRITRRQRTETRQFTGTIRRERAELDKGELADRVREVGQ